MAKTNRKDALEIDGAKVPWERAPDHRNIYVNVMALAATQYDFQIRLGQTTTNSDGTGATHTEVATVLMAPAQAKALVAILTRAVADWETTNGKLVLPEHLSADQGKAKNKSE